MFVYEGILFWTSHRGVDVCLCLFGVSLFLSKKGAEKMFRKNRHIGRNSKKKKVLEHIFQVDRLPGEGSNILGERSLIKQSFCQGISTPLSCIF